MEAPLWTAEIGLGYSSPSVASGRVLALGYFGDESTPGEGVDRVSCLDAETGAVIWTYEYPARIYDNEHEGGTLSTPTAAAEAVYVAARSGQVRALSASDGSLLWEADLVERHGVDPGRYGFASSPFVLGENIVLNASRTVALERATGETTWISDDYEARYSTVAPIELGSRDSGTRVCLVTFGSAGLVVIDATDGSHVHTFVFKKSERNVEGATPIVIAEPIAGKQANGPHSSAPLAPRTAPSAGSSS